MLLGEGLFGLVAIALWAYCIFDVIRTDEADIQNLPKIIWLMIVLFLPTTVTIPRLIHGRPRGASFSFEPRTPARPSPTPHPSVGSPEPPPLPDDYHERREEALRRYEAEREELRRREEDLRKREEDLRRREQGPG